MATAKANYTVELWRALEQLFPQDKQRQERRFAALLLDVTVWGGPETNIRLQNVP